MDFSCEDESGIDVAKLVVSNSTHRINIVHASINTRRCRTCQYDDIIKRIVDRKSLIYVS